LNGFGDDRLQMDGYGLQYVSPFCARNNADHYFFSFKSILNACGNGYNVKQRKYVSYGSWSNIVCCFFISGDRAVSWDPRSYLEQAINDAMAAADNRHVLSHSGIMKIRRELERKESFRLKKINDFIWFFISSHIFISSLID
jgi:hypothetical protein